ncbi:FAD dependent oxidoreductase [Macroventuria anomochaeta]|uniref:FAD dependent oxidoreductase n=1 Tax=Macroventuria anomochaeta TaxID=301207 RepID=A0ACB6S5W3_9PLEO|nr:FAD dependent oxidoreductase [Macroventuria anomochaeta]KAF2629640.1 FAD dependent oxidoreductase [Macroventuria anomochaeta]
MGISKNEHIAIIGGGAFGLSTAFELSQQGYTDITVFEKDTEIPSRWSAANDLNKIMRAEYEDPWYTELGVEAAKKWQTPLYAPYFHRVGYLNCVSGAGTQKAINSMNSFKAAGEAHPEIKPWVYTVSTRQELQDICWQFNQGEMPGWKGYFNRYDGYVHSANALRGIYRAARSNGVRFFLGERRGAIQEIVYKGTGSSKKSVGVKTKDGQFHAASLVIVATGAAASKIVPEVGARVSAKSWSVAHVRLTDEETAALRGIPVTYARDLGFFFEPDPKTNLLKLCPMGGGFINTNPATGVSEAPEGVQRFVPPEDERKMRELLRQTLPYLADRPLVEKTLCWFADTSDSDFIIDYLPETGSTVMVLSGDSGHGFKMFPIVGSWVNNLLNAPEGKQIEKRWQWRTNKPNDGSASQDDVSWRVGDVQELRDITPSVAKL